MKISQKQFTAANEIVRTAIREDPELERAFQANIAMAFMDNADWYRKRNGKKSLSRKDLHLIANQAATYFIGQWVSR